MSEIKTNPNQFSFLNEDKRKEEEMMKYIKAHEQEALNNYGYDKDKTDEKKQKIATFIHDHYDTMDMKAMRKIVLDCMTEKKIRKELLEFELRHYIEKSKSMSIQIFTEKAKFILDRYQCKAGGFYIEDMDWEIHGPESEKYDVKNHEVLFANSVDKTDKDDNENLHYLKRLVTRLNSLSEEIEVKYEFYGPEKGLIWIGIWCTRIDIEKDCPKIGL